jgi:energy-coupling factor transport system substrate-specific component
MTWQLAAFTLLAVALAGGFAWYERTKPDARIVALVATLAAFAAIGRIAFAAFPNVKPTSDIVLISGYALGGAPGFVVGAVAGLTSNFFFGQGPWTPWQMAAWGLTGVLGAGLAIVTRGRISRWSLALVCTAAGFAFAAMQDVGDWVTYSDHSAGALGAYVGSGLGFDAIDAFGCLAFALAFGPWLLRSVQRFARRIQVVWRPSGGRIAAVIALALAGSAAWWAGQPGSGVGTAFAAATPTDYLLSAQNTDGGFGSSPGQPSSTLFSGWAALGLAAVGRSDEVITHGGANLLAYEEIHAGGTDPGSIERTILIAHAAGASPTAFGGRDLVAELERRIRSNGSISDQVNLTAFGILALRAAGVSASRSIAWVERQQDTDGGFSFTMAGGGSDVDDTGAALEALAGAGGRAPGIRGKAVRFIRRQQNHDGGFPSLPGGTSNAQSTAWAVQGLIADGIAPAYVHRAGSPSPTQYLNSLIAPNGHINYARGTDQTPVWVTAEALMALAGKPLPLAPVRTPAAAVHRHSRSHVRQPSKLHPKPRKPHRKPGHRRQPTARTSAPPTPPDLAPLAAIATALVLAPLGD